MNATDITDTLTNEQIETVTDTRPIHTYGQESYWIGDVDGHGDIVVIVSANGTEAFGGFANHHEAHDYATRQAAESMASTEEVDDFTATYGPDYVVATRTDNDGTRVITITPDTATIDTFDFNDPEIEQQLLRSTETVANALSSSTAETFDDALIGAANIRYRAASAVAAAAQSRLGDLIRDAKRAADIGRSGHITVTDLAGKLRVSREQLTQVIAGTQWR